MDSETSPRDVVDLVCKVLKVPYIVEDVPNHPLRFRMFTMKGDYDCVLCGSDEQLWPRIVQYFKVMFNFVMA